MSDDSLFRKIILEIPKATRVLDLGSGNNGQWPSGRPVRYAKILGAAGYQVTAVDRKEGVGLPWPGVEYFQTSVEEFLKTNYQPSDLVICSNILQFVDPQAIVDLPKLVATGGYLFVRTFADQVVVLETVSSIEGLELLDERAYTVHENHPPEGQHTHDVVELVFRKLQVE